MRGEQMAYVLKHCPLKTKRTEHSQQVVAEGCMTLKFIYSFLKHSLYCSADECLSLFVSLAIAIQC